MHKETIAYKNNLTQEEFIDGLKTNNELVMGTLYNGNYPKIEAYVVKNSGSKTMAKDIFQEAFIATWKNVRNDKFQIQHGTTIDAYLCQIARNKWKDFLRSTTYRNTINAEEVGNLRIVEDEIETEKKCTQEEKSKIAVMKAIDLLGEQCRSLLMKFYFERKSMKDIAGELQLDAASTRNKKYRCMQRLREFAFEAQIRNGQ